MMSSILRLSGWTYNDSILRDHFKRSFELILLCFSNDSDGLFDCVHLFLQPPDIQINQTNKNGANALMKLCQW